MIWQILTITALVLAAAGLLYSIHKERKNNRCDGCSLKETCRRNKSDCTYN
nr:FeoB-associated Cys-rich membrane protein [Paludibacteraceae bacterium]